MSIKELNKLTLLEAIELYESVGLGFDIRDGKIKGFIK